MKFLISGISSFLGFELAKELYKRGEEIFGIVRQSSLDSFKELCVKENIKVNIIELDMDEISNLPSIQKEKIDICLHFAWAGVGAKGRNNKEIQAKNFENTLEFIKAAAKMSCKRFIFAGSQAEYGVTYEKIKSGMIKDTLCTEFSETNPLSEYGKTKLGILSAGKKLANELDMEYIHLRIFSIYGKRDHKTTLISTCLNFANNHNEKDKLKLGECLQKWNYMYDKDFAKSVCDLSFVPYEKFEKFNEKNAEDIDREKNEPVINIASADTRILKDFVLEIANAFEIQENLEFEKREVSMEGTPYLNPSIKKLKELIGYKKETSFLEGIRTIEKLYNM